jgi:hypothetical protein
MKNTTVYIWRNWIRRNRISDPSLIQTRFESHLKPLWSAEEYVVPDYFQAATDYVQAGPVAGILMMTAGFAVPEIMPTFALLILLSINERPHQG